MKIDNVILSTIQVNENLKQISDEQQTIIAEPSLIDESSPLLQN